MKFKVTAARAKDANDMEATVNTFGNELGGREGRGHAVPVASRPIWIRVCM